jgi:Zn-dependent peptidase ImmA (M78 family)
VGFFFLPEPPTDSLPIPDFRTMANQALVRPSPNLLDTIYLCQQRQAWYQDYAQVRRLGPVDFVSTSAVNDPIVEVAQRMRERLGFDIEARRRFSTWEEALRSFIALADQAGVMVMCSGVVGNNTHRTLDPQEFRGFALADSLAPLVFVNGADTKSAQMFTLAHELAHLWLGQSALSNTDVAVQDAAGIERWCNQVAAELLMPMTAVRAELVEGEPLEIARQKLARRFKVSTLVVLRRLWDANVLSDAQFWAAYRQEVNRLASLQRPGGGGNFYLSQAARVSKRFARALVESTLEGQTLYRDAMKMLGVSKVGTFNELGRTLGYPL